MQAIIALGFYFAICAGVILGSMKMSQNMQP